MSEFNDDQMDTLLRNAHVQPNPTFSPEFERRLKRRLQPRRLSATGRRVIGIYGVVAAAVSVWTMRDLPMGVIAAAILLSAAVPAAMLFRRRAS